MRVADGLHCLARGGQFRALWRMPFPGLPVTFHYLLIYIGMV